MDSSAAVIHLAALAQESRLQIFRLLVRQGPEGLCVSDIGEKLHIAPATLSFHLKELCQAGLITANRQSRHIYYAPDFAVMNMLVEYLTEHCCEGRGCDVPKVKAVKKRVSKS